MVRKKKETPDLGPYRTPDPPPSEEEVVEESSLLESLLKAKWRWDRDENTPYFRCGFPAKFFFCGGADFLRFRSWSTGWAWKRVPYDTFSKEDVDKLCHHLKKEIIAPHREKLRRQQEKQAKEFARKVRSKASNL
jgi:hypothetical protein